MAESPRVPLLCFANCRWGIRRARPDKEGGDYSSSNQAGERPPPASRGPGPEPESAATEENSRRCRRVASLFVYTEGVQGLGHAERVHFVRRSFAVPAPLIESACSPAKFETANRYAFLHSISLAFLPSLVPAKQPLCLSVTSVFFTAGTALFSGGVYGKVLTGNDDVGKVAPVGGISLVLGWLSFALLRR